jgi:fructose-bisphosphate aldolase, class II
MNHFIRGEMMKGNIMFEALADEPTIIMACNTRVTKGIARGIMRAAKDADAAVIFELAKSECDLNGGYTGLTPQMYADRIRAAADEAGHDVWLLHADHITVKTGTPEEMADVKKLIAAQIEAGYMSFAIDASHLFDLNGKTVEEELAKNVEKTVELAKFIHENAPAGFGLEVEVGEIGRTDSDGMVLTSPEEATCFIRELLKRGVKPHVLAIANGSTHGNVYDENGKPIEQSSIDIKRTIEVGRALSEMSSVRIAQHGITGTPLRIIKYDFPKQYIRKGNVGTHWQNIVWEALEKYEHALYNKIWNWTIEKYRKPGKSDIEVFGKNSKYAIKQFFNEIDHLGTETEKHLERMAMQEAKIFFDAFNAKGTASVVRGW